VKPEEYATKVLELQGWRVRLCSYRLGDEYHCTADNVEPGANIARARGATREEAERSALERAGERLATTRRHPLA
jgi:hypothetical protein